ncbi:MAG: DUF6259 domain-containing protein [Victivallales bacterium]
MKSTCRFMTVATFGAMMAIWGCAQKQDMPSQKTTLSKELRVQPLKVVENDRSFTAVTERLEATFEDGMIVHLINPKTGEVIADRKHDDRAVPTGMGCLNNDVASLRKFHVPWGATTLNQHLEAGIPMPNYRRPCERSRYALEKTGAGVRATWTGLSNGKDFYPDDELAITVGEDAQGALTVQTRGTSKEPGVFGAVTPLINISADAKFILPHFGGMEFDRNTQKPALMPFGGAPFYEAPVMALEMPQSSVGMWVERDEFRNYYVFFNYSGKSFSFSFELSNLMPFEQHKTIEAETVKLDCFAGGDWKTALTPYRDWYRNYFKDEIKVRDAVKWAHDINVVVDPGSYDAKALSRVAELFPKEAVMFHDWNARKPKFDTELPDWTPRDGYIEQVKRIHSFGFKTMAYVNTYCVNYNSPVWKKDNISEFILTRKDGIAFYKGATVTNELLTGTINYTEGKNQFAGMKDGQLFYGDPLSTRWREYHADMMKWWNTITGTDANYEDTAGCVADSGNGIVDGLSGGQGAVAQMRLLQKTQPNVPMASEYGPDGIAFAVMWPLNYVQAWGNAAFRRHRLHRQHPVTVFIYGYRTWIPYIRSDNDFIRHLAAGCSDALNGMGMMAAGPDMQDQLGFNGHLVYRARLFAQLGLQPYFPDGHYKKHIRSMYKDRDGKLYKYYDDGKLQQLLGSDDHALYGRVDGLDRVATDLVLPGWPMYADGMIFGLDPKNNYALFPKSKAASTVLRIRELPDGVGLGKYYETPEGVFLELRSNSNESKAKSVTIEFNRDYEHVYVNDKEVPFARTLKVSDEFPLRLQAVNNSAARPFNEPFTDKITTRTISAGGISETDGTPIFSVMPADKKSRKAMMYYNGQTDFLVAVPSSDTSLVTYIQNKSSTYGDGSIAKIFVNGRLIREFDCMMEKAPGPGKTKPGRVFDTKVRKWTVPLGAYAGKTVWVTLLTDYKGDGNSDSQWWTLPMLVQDAAQKNEESTVNATKVPKPLSAVDGKISVQFDDDSEIPLNTGERIDTTNACSGKGCLAIEGDGKYKYKLIQLKLEPDRKYTVSMNIRKSANASRGHISAGLFNLSKEGGIVNKYGEWSVGNDDTWHAVKGTFTTPATVANTALFLYNVNAQGIVLFDGIVIEEDKE